MHAQRPNFVSIPRFQTESLKTLIFLLSRIVPLHFVLLCCLPIRTALARMRSGERGKAAHLHPNLDTTRHSFHWQGGIGKISAFGVPHRRVQELSLTSRILEGGH